MANSSPEHPVAEQYANRSWSDRFSPNHEFSYSSGVSCLFHFLLILLLGLWLTAPTNKDRGAVEVELISIAPEPNPGDGVDPGGGEPVLEEARPTEEGEFEEAEVVENAEVAADTQVTSQIADAPAVTRANPATKSAASDAIAQLKAKQPVSSGGGTGTGSGAGEGAGAAGGGGGASVEDLIGALKAAGAGTGDIQFSLGWGGPNDLDLHVQTPSGQIISFRRPNSTDGGILDLDANAGGRIISRPVENIFWNSGTAPEGVYQVSVNYYAYQGGTIETPFQVIIQIDGKPKKTYRQSIATQGATLHIAPITFTRD